MTMTTDQTQTSVADDLVASLIDTFSELVRADPAQALAALDELSLVLSDAEFGFTPLTVRIEKSTGREILTLNGNDVRVISVETSTRTTRCEGVMTDKTVRFDHGEADYEALVYAVERPEGLTPVRLPDGWVEKVL